MAGRGYPALSTRASGLLRVLGEEHSHLALVDGALVVAGNGAGDDGSSIVVLSADGALPALLAGTQRNEEQQVCIAAVPGKPLFVAASKDGQVVLYKAPGATHARTLMLCPLRVQTMSVSDNMLL